MDLLLRLRDGQSPRVVVFYDGLNDVAAFVQNQRPGWPQNERNRSRDFEMGKAVLYRQTGLVSEARAIGYLTISALARFEVLQRLQPFSVRGSLPPGLASSTEIESLLTSYAGTIRVVEGLAREYDFQPLYIWQPSIHATHKPLSAGEKQIFADLQNTEFSRRLVEVHRVAATRVDEFARSVAVNRFLNLSNIFDRETMPVFADGLGHTYESANDSLASALFPRVIQALNQKAVAIRCS
jgi:hypothetical protein